MSETASTGGDGRVPEVDAVLPETWFADLPTVDRVRVLVTTFNRSVEVINRLEAAETLAIECEVLRRALRMACYDGWADGDGAMLAYIRKVLPESATENEVADITHPGRADG